MSRVFKYGDQSWADPGEQYTEKDVQNQLATFLPELTNAGVQKKNLPDGTVEIEFVKKSGTKGAVAASARAGVPCYSCGEIFQPDADKLRAWAESGAPYDPTDWECPECARLDAGLPPADADAPEGDADEHAAG
jgi:PRTRC genetic system protein C